MNNCIRSTITRRALIAPGNFIRLGVSGRIRPKPCSSALVVILLGRRRGLTSFELRQENAWARALLRRTPEMILDRLKKAREGDVLTMEEARRELHTRHQP